MKLNATELTWIGKDERALTLIENEMIMLLWPKIRLLSPQLAAHAEVKSEPAVSGKVKQHSLPARLGSHEPRTREILA